jgi:hypothetical protein
MKKYGGVDVWTHAFSTSHKLEISGELHASAALTRGNILVEETQVHNSVKRTGIV